jgi:nucleotide-binding universal stress UspA family protein
MADRSASFRSLLIGIDGSREARQAVAFVASLTPPPGGHVTVLRVVEPGRLPSLGLLPAGVRTRLEAEVSSVREAEIRAARRDVDRAVARLESSGWRARGEVRTGVPLAEMLAEIKTLRADLLVVGARGVGRVERVLLGSVADGVTKRAPIPVLVVR